MSHLTGNIVVINVSCKEKGPKGKYFTSCFMFKTAGTHVGKQKYKQAELENFELAKMNERKKPPYRHIN